MTERNRRPRSDAVEILRQRYVAGNDEAAALLEEVREQEDLARMIYRLRTRAGLTQVELAQRIGTTSSVISRLEDADYSGHSLPMLRRIAAALGRRLEIRFPVVKSTQPTKRRRTAGSNPSASRE